MSYLEMAAAPVPDMSSGIISIWFREVSKQQKDPPDSHEWPQGFWTTENAGQVMVPPNAQYSIGVDPEFKNKSVFFFNPYGSPTGGQFFGDMFLGAAPVWIPNSPPIPLNTMSAGQDGAMSAFGIRTLITFGNPDLDYNYCSWRIEYPNVIPYVRYLPSVGIAGEGGLIPDWPWPYKPFIKVEAGKPQGVGGAFRTTNYRINEPRKRLKLPPSFIGIDADGHIVINLQTSTTATFSGMSFEMTHVGELIASATYLEIIGPPYSYTQLGFPFPDGYWVEKKGFWNGYEFEYADISQKVMGCAPESFLIYARNIGITDAAYGAPMVEDGGWHHLLFSFDISGSVRTSQPETNSPSITTECKAWMAFDGVNITGPNLQNRPPVHDGFLLPKLRGTQTTQILDCGPCSAYGRAQFDMGDNGILPRNAWLHGFNGNPKDNLVRLQSEADIITNEGGTKNLTAIKWGGKVGDFNWMDWTGLIWPLYGHGVAPGNWKANFFPPGPTVPDPKESLLIPTYTCDGFSIPVKGHPIGIPCGHLIPEYNTGVEMAELQIWANRTLDTSALEMRRLFIDKNGKATKPSVAAKVLGKPDILLHGSNNWRIGRNTGKAGIDDKGKPIPAGQFKPVARIANFKPNPQLGK